MADGWLWLSMRMAAAMPSPTSTTPAFSPGPTSTHSASVGSRFRCLRLDLYEQCSDHMTANMANSRWFGSRSRILAMSAASSSVNPRARWMGSAMSRTYPSTARVLTPAEAESPRSDDDLTCVESIDGRQLSSMDLTLGLIFAVWMWSPRTMVTTKRKKTPMSDSHKAALAE